MRHYSKIEWQQFINNHLDALLELEMQEHLLTCEDCRAIYLELIDESIDTEVTVSAGFTDRLMESIHKENAETAQRKHKQGRRNMLIYYTSAACITLFLMSSGAFQSMYQGITSSDKYVLGTLQKQSLFQSGWTNKLTDKTSKLIHQLKREI